MGAVQLRRLQLAAVAAVGLVMGCAGAGSPDSVASAPPPPRGIVLEPSLAARLAAEAGSGIDLSTVLPVGAAGDETIVVAGLSGW